MGFLEGDSVKSLSTDQWVALTTPDPTPEQRSFRFTALADLVQARGPEKLNMHAWITDTTSSPGAPGAWCATPACIAGTAALLAVDLDLINLRHNASSWPLAQVAGIAQEFTSKWLGLTDTEANELFVTDRWPDNVTNWITDYGFASGPQDAHEIAFDEWRAAIAFLRAAADPDRDFMAVSVHEIIELGL